MISKFFCDIRNTYNGSFNREKALSEFVYHLNNLDDSEIMYFSFVSSDDVDYVKECMKELEPFLLGSKIVFGNQYAFDKVIIGNSVNKVDSSKPAQIYAELATGDCHLAYYADDKSLYGKILRKVINTKLPDINLVTFEPTNGIDSLNKLLHESISNKSAVLKR